MSPMTRTSCTARIVAALALGAALALPASATTTFEGSISSTLGDGFVLLSPHVGPVDAWDSGCSANQCAFGRLDGTNGLQHFNLSEQTGCVR